MDTTTPARFVTGTARADDGTLIGYRRIGHGPALVLVHGAMMTSYLFRQLAIELAADFTVYAPDRRGRGLSDPGGATGDLRTEIGDLTTLIREAQAHNVFGLSAGAIISLATALELPDIHRLALYEPPLVGADFTSLGWAPRVERELDAHRFTAAVVSVLKGTGDRADFTSLPRFLLQPALALGMRLDERDDGEDRLPPLRTLVPTVRADIEVIRSTRDIWHRLPELHCDTLLLGGTRSASYLPRALDRLAAELPGATRVVLPGLGHTSAFDDEKPDVVAAELRKFFTRPDAGPR
ncbi:alpha/beta fold hydrolase [Nocardia sp. BMG111209]|uniref:alpha/beta fold hydrolase n=1 Tax=Nocardia sp. BMG111209 TaxID=1160137 RepID=UPI0003A9E75E|nr:alpha/beta hydrolase [Nocardia sp. BMG111209]